RRSSPGRDTSRRSPPRPMRFLADENLRRDVVKYLREQGHDVLPVPPGATDAAVAALARAEGRVLLTNDADFARTLAYPPRDFPGIVVFRLHPPGRQRYVRALRRVLARKPEALNGKTVIVRDDSVIELS